MSEFTPTPGPWKANCFMVVATSVDPQSVYGGQEVCHTGNGRTKSEEAEANARLIAAAPELLEVCEKIVDYRRRAGPLGFQLEKLDDFIHVAKVAISKAMGDQ